MEVVAELEFDTDSDSEHSSSDEPTEIDYPDEPRSVRSDDDVSDVETNSDTEMMELDVPPEWARPPKVFVACMDPCPICHSTIGETIAFDLPCKHIFHAECLEEWFSKSDTCPMCRKKCSK